MTNKPESTEAQGCGMDLNCAFCGSPPHIETGLVHGDALSCSSDRCFMMTIGLPREVWNTRAVNQSALFERAMEVLEYFTQKCPEPESPRESVIREFDSIIQQAKAILREKEGR